MRQTRHATDPTGGTPLFGLDAPVERVRTHDGAELAVERAGQGGCLVVLAHCWTGDRRVWSPVARRLVDQGHTVVRYDQRGHGDSTMGADGPSLEAIGRDLATVLDHQGAERAVVGGHSMGGMAIMSLAASRPEVLRDRAERVVLAATACRLPLSRRRRGAGPRVVGSRRVTRAMANRRLGPRLVRDFVGRPAHRAHLQAIAETFCATPGHVRAGFLEAMLEMDLRAALAQLTMPATVVVGDRDRHTPPEAARTVADSLADSRLVVVPDAGHMLPFEAPDLLAWLLLGEDRSPAERRSA